jgi:hypothetical protein
MFQELQTIALSVAVGISTAHLSDLLGVTAEAERSELDMIFNPYEVF